MTNSVSGDRSQGRLGARRRFFIAALLFVVIAAVSARVFAAAEGIRLRSHPASHAFSQTIRTKGLDAAVAQYRSLRVQGFPGLSESESDTNNLGYEFLQQGNTAAAISVFKLNLETHPKSANVYDSLGEAYADSGNRRLAVENYQRALALDPDSKSAGMALREFTGTPRKLYSPLVFLHLGAGIVGILFGGVALGLRKGSHQHRLTGDIAAIGMLGVAAAGAYLGLVKSQPSNVLAGVVTLYFVATAWWAARRTDVGTTRFDWCALLVASALVGGFGINAIDAANSGQAGAALYMIFGTVILLATVSDIRMIVRGRVVGGQRIVRHLWRMSVALFIVTSSFFLGQSQLFPEVLRSTHVLAVPSMLIVMMMFFWLARILLTRAYRPGGTARSLRTTGSTRAV